MTDSPKSSSASSVTEEAAAWLLRMQSRDCTDRDRQAFQAWLQADAAHATEYEALLEVWNITGSLEPAFEPSAEQEQHPKKRRA
jgi:transmembrane sensor